MSDAQVSFGITTYPGGASGILAANVVGLSQGVRFDGETTIGVNTFRYNAMLNPATIIDGFVKDNYLDVIGQRKNSIISLGNFSVWQTNAVYYNSKSAAENALDSMYGGNGDSTSVITEYNTITNINFPATTAANGSISQGAVITQFGSDATGIAVSAISTPVNQAYALLVKDVSGTFIAGAGNTILVSGIGFTEASSINYVGAGNVYQDVTLISFFPNLEPPDSSVASPFIPRESKILVDSNKGLGVGNTYYPNATNNLTIGSLVQSVDTLPKIGEVLAINPSAGNVSQISTLRTQIGELRTGIVSYANGSSTVKSRKKAYALNIWTLQKNRDDFNQEIAAMNAAINVLDDSAMGGPY
tara:strand:- start:146 stop:1222 length:1077 start_codon:yes stop_codon:yes gene_type:complete